MAKKMADCIAAAIKANYITPDEGKEFLAIYDQLRRMGQNDAEAKQGVALEVKLRAEKREANALLMAEKIVDLDREEAAWRNAVGKPDPAQAHKMSVFRRSDEGRFVGLPDDSNLGVSLTQKTAIIRREIEQKLSEPNWEFRRGAISGDKRRTSTKLAAVSPGAQRVQARLTEFTKAMRGEATDDARAKELADIAMGVAEWLRQRFNKAGGMIGKLEGWGGPQWHNPSAILKAGMKEWVEFTFQLLDRKRMVHPLTKRALSDQELIEGLQASWKTITSNGHFDEEKIGGQPVGRGALWVQHADHRFLHFKSGKAWMDYAKRFGNPDPWVAFKNWTNTMARDIAAMEKFGPNPETTLRYRQSVIRSKAHMVKPTEVIIAEEKQAREQQTVRLKELQSKMIKPNPDWEALTDRHAVLIDEINALRHSRVGMASVVVGAWNRDPGPDVKALRDRMGALHLELLDVTQKMLDIEAKGEQHLVDVAIQQEFRELLDTMATTVKTEPVTFADVSNPVDYVEKIISQTNTIWNGMRGANGVPESMMHAEIVQTTKSFVSATILPMAVLSALADPVFQTTKRFLIGMSANQANPFKILYDTMRQMTPMSRREAMQSMITLDANWNFVRQASADDTRWAKTRASVDYMGDRVHSIGLLSPYTQAAKASIDMAVMGHLANNVDQAWGQLNPDTRDMLSRAGFTEQGWDQIRRAKLYEPANGAPFLRANEIADVSPALAERYLGMLELVRQYSNIEPTPESRAFMLGNTKPGTVPGSALRIASTLKGFPVAVIFMWMGQMRNDLAAGNYRSAAITASSLLIIGAFMGAFTMALKDVAAGRDPRKWLDENTYIDGNMWLAAILQAGGLGIYGDFLFSEVNRQGGSMSTTIAGPVVDRIEALKRLTVDNIIQAARGKDTHVMRELFRVLRQNTPTVLWNRLLMERMVWDRAQLAFDPEARTYWQRERNKRRTEYGQEYWFGPGDLTPQRAPDVSRVFATRK